MRIPASAVVLSSVLAVGFGWAYCHPPQPTDNGKVIAKSDSAEATRSKDSTTRSALRDTVKLYVPESPAQARSRERLRFLADSLGKEARKTITVGDDSVAQLQSKVELLTEANGILVRLYDSTAARNQVLEVSLKAAVRLDSVSEARIRILEGLNHDLNAAIKKSTSRRLRAGPCLSTTVGAGLFSSHSVSGTAGVGYCLTYN